MNNNKRKQNDTVIIILGSIVAAMLVLILLIVFASKFLKPKINTPTDTNAILTSNGFLTEGMKVDNGATEKAKSAASTLAGRQVYYAGLEDCTVNQNTVVYLENLEDNIDIYMTYEITVDGNVIFQTDLIPPGEYVEWTPAEILEAGKTYAVYLKETPYYEEKEGEFLPLTSPINMVNITVTR